MRYDTKERIRLKAINHQKMTSRRRKPSPALQDAQVAKMIRLLVEAIHLGTN